MIPSQGQEPGLKVVRPAQYVEGRRGRRGLQAGAHPPTEPTRAEQESHDPGVDLQRARQGRGMVVLSERQDLRTEERRLRREERAGLQRVIRSRSEELEGEADRRPLARGVVLQVGVELFVSLVDLWGETDDQDLLFGGGQGEGVGQAGQREGGAVLQTGLVCG